MLPDHETKIVATIGPASESPEMLERLMAISAAQAVVQCRLSLGSRVNLSFGGKKISILQFLAWKKWYTLFDSA